jgi:hypothetical protein
VTWSDMRIRALSASPVQLSAQPRSRERGAGRISA